jgi:hypothetical protein
MHGIGTSRLMAGMAINNHCLTLRTLDMPTNRRIKSPDFQIIFDLFRCHFTALFSMFPYFGRVLRRAPGIEPGGIDQHAEKTTSNKASIVCNRRASGRI